MLLCGAGVKPAALLEGGTGSISIRQEMPDFLPDRLEAGTHNMPGIAGLLAGVRFVRRQGTEAILHHEQVLTRRAAERLERLPGVETFACPEGTAQAGVLSFRVSGRDVEEIGEALAERGIAVRAGLHCAPAGPPHRRNIGYRDGAGQLFCVQYAAGSGHTESGFEGNLEINSEQDVNF